MGQLPAESSPIQENDDDTQMRENLLKFYVYSVKLKPLFFGSRRGVLS
ncbi:hypothetical protein ACFOWO_10170 [Saccharococcus thermophilus]